MLTTPMLDPLGAVVAELRADDDVAALVSDRVRGGEPRGLSTTYEGDALGPGLYKAFVVVTTLDRPPHPSLPIQRAIFGVACYGVTYQNAAAVWGAVVKAMHRVGERVKANGQGIYISAIETGGSQDKDPDTKQPVVRGTIRLIATASSVSPVGS